MNCEKNQLDFLLHCYVSHLTTSSKEHEYMMLRMPMVANYPSIQSFQNEKCQRIWCYATRWLSQIFRYISITWWPPRIFFFFLNILGPSRKSPLSPFLFMERKKYMQGKEKPHSSSRCGVMEYLMLNLHSWKSWFLTIQTCWPKFVNFLLLFAQACKPKFVNFSLQIITCHHFYKREKLKSTGLMITRSFLCLIIKYAQSKFPLTNHYN